MTIMFIITPILGYSQFHILSSNPADGIANVDPSQDIRIRFSETPEIGTFQGDGLRIRGTKSGAVQGTLAYLGQGEIMFTPDNDFMEGELIVIQIKKTVSSIDGNRLGTPLTITFRVRSAVQFRMSADETLLGSRTAQSIITSDQDPELTYEVLLGRAEDLAVGRLGIDVVKLSSYTIGLERATAIQTGWYLSPTTYFGIIHEVYETTPRTLFRLEYALKENMELVVTQGNDRRQGIDLLWGKNY